MTLTRVAALRLSAEMARCLKDLRLIVDRTCRDLGLAVELVINQIECVETILHLEERRTAHREEPECGFTPFRAGSIPACKN